jgi:hypothetical protein
MDENLEDVEAGLLKVACEQLLEDAGELLIRPGLTIMRVSGSPLVDSGSGYVELERVSSETASEIIAVANKQVQLERQAEEDKYLDPEKNPLIKIEPD